MSTRATYAAPDWRAAGIHSIEAMERAGKAAVEEWAEGLRDENRDQVVAAGLGLRLANVWKGKAYPESGASANAAGVVYVTAGRNRTGSAPDIISFFSSSEIVTPLRGRFLAIPTEDVPRSRGGRAMSVAEVQARFGRQLQFIDPGDRGFRTPSIRRAGVAFLVLKKLVVRKSTQRWRNRTRREAERGRRGEDVIMFILVPQVAGQKKLSPDETFRRWVARFPELLERNFEAQAKALEL